MGGGSGGGGRGGRSGGGGLNTGDRMDLTTPAKEMGLDKTISEISKLDTAIKAAEAKYDKVSEDFVAGTATREQRKAVRNEVNALRTRQQELTGSIRRTVENGREIIVKKGEKKDLGPFQGSWRGHFGIPRG